MFIGYEKGNENLRYPSTLLKYDFTDHLPVQDKRFKEDAVYSYGIFNVHDNIEAGSDMYEVKCRNQCVCVCAVSYTHLDVYKRQMNILLAISTLTIHCIILLYAF